MNWTFPELQSLKDLDINLNKLIKELEYQEGYGDSKKYTGRFYISSCLAHGFEVAKKIIGKNGNNMKSIIDRC